MIIQPLCRLEPTGGATASIFPAVDKLVSQPDYQSALNYVGYRKNMLRYRSMVDFLFVELFPRYRARCFQFYKRTGPALRAELPAEAVGKCAGLMVSALHIALRYLETEEAISWKAFRKEALAPRRLSVIYMCGVERPPRTRRAVAFCEKCARRAMKLNPGLDGDGRPGGDQHCGTALDIYHAWRFDSPRPGRDNPLRSGELPIPYSACRGGRTHEWAATEHPYVAIKLGFRMLHGGDPTANKVCFGDLDTHV